MDTPVHIVAQSGYTGIRIFFSLFVITMITYYKVLHVRTYIIRSERRRFSTQKIPDPKTFFHHDRFVILIDFSIVRSSLTVPTAYVIRKRYVNTPYVYSTHPTVKRVRKYNHDLRPRVTFDTYYFKRGYSFWKRLRKTNRGFIFKKYFVN